MGTRGGETRDMGNTGLTVGGGALEASRHMETGQDRTGGLQGGASSGTHGGAGSSGGHGGAGNSGGHGGAGNSGGHGGAGSSGGHGGAGSSGGHGGAGSSGGHGGAGSSRGHGGAGSSRGHGGTTSETTAPAPASVSSAGALLPPPNFLGENRGSIGHLGGALEAWTLGCAREAGTLGGVRESVTGGRCRGAGTGGRCRGAGTGGRCRGAGTGGRCRGAGTEEYLRGSMTSGLAIFSAGWLALFSAGRLATGFAAGGGGLGEPRTMAGRFWLGPGHSPDTGGSLPSILVQWCLGGPRDDGHWPRARTARGWWRHRGPSPWRACRIPRSTRGKGDHGGKGQ